MGRKNFFIAASIIVAAALFLGNCSGTKKSEVSNDKVIEIKEKMFISQVNDIYLNTEDYLGKTIKLQGLFKEEKPYEGDPYCFVLRYGPGCCGYDGNVGFEIKWDESRAQPFPKVDSWIETTGVLKKYEADGYADYLYLDLISLNVLKKRGAEIVTQ